MTNNKPLIDILEEAATALPGVPIDTSELNEFLTQACEFMEAAPALLHRLRELEHALGMTYFFKEFTEEWADLTNSDVVLFMKLRDEALKGTE